MLKQRLSAAWQAFRDPGLVGEAKGMREAVIELAMRDDLALLRYQWLGDDLAPRIDRLPVRDQRAIRRYLGWH